MAKKDSIEEFVIESGIEISPTIRGGKWKNLANKMGVGDSVKLAHRQAMALTTAMKKQGMQGATRKVDGELIRVWRIK